MTLLLLVGCSAIVNFVATETGTYVHVTDFHYDWTHSQETANFDIGAPWTFIESAIEHIAIVCPKPDFIIWTGDSIPYLSDSQFYATNVAETIRNITVLLSSKFSTAKLYPVLGNHDYSPANNLPDQTNPIYEEVGKFWSAWIGQQPTFVAYGYYKTKLSNSTVLLGLNTNFYMERNKAVFKNGSDPGNQLAWMEAELESAKQANMKVIIIGHVSPGAFEWVANLMLMVPKYNEPFLDIITKYASVIKHMHFGHSHTGSFRILMDSSNRPAVPIFMAPAVLPGKFNNPGYRIVNYDRQTFDITNYMQYYLNLSKATSFDAKEWKLEHEFPRVYSMNDMTPQSMFTLQQEIVKNGSLFDLYVQLSSARKRSNCTDAPCKRMQLCALLFLRFDNYNRCMNQPMAAVLPLVSSHSDNIYIKFLDLIIAVTAFILFTQFSI